MDKHDQVTLLLRKNGFTFSDDGRIIYPRDGQHYFNQNLLLTLYINNAVDRDGDKFRVRKVAPVRELQPA